MSRPKKRRILHVVFDTNSLFTSSIRELFSPAASELLKQNNRHADLDTVWLVPEIVRKEREYQMREAAEKLLNGVGKLESLVKVNWGVNSEWVDRAVTTAVDTQLTELKVGILSLKPDLVDWNSLIDASVRRLPPFDKGEKEKGFRDSIVCECFVQLAQSLPSGTREQAVLVTADLLLVEAVKARIHGFTNARIVNDLDGLQGTLNIMLSQVAPEFAQELVTKANAMFYIPSQTETMYYTQKVDETIKARFSDAFSALPENASSIAVQKSTMHHTNFEKKDGQRVYFINRLIYELKATRLEASTEDAKQGSQGPLSLKLGLLGAMRNVETVANRAAVFDIHWSATLTQTKKLQRESIDDYRLVSVNDIIQVTDADLF
jgi:hypothetical protein